MSGKTAIIISIGVLLGALGLLLYTNLNSNMVYYYHVDEFFAKAGSLTGETVKVNGKVVDQSIHKQQLDYQFIIKGKSGKTMNVSYHGIVPDTFKNGSDVVVEGVYNPGTARFTATTLLAKCPTKYESQQQAYRADQTPATKQN